MKRAWIPAIFAVGVLSPYLSTGYYQDDSFSSLFPTIIRQHGLTLFPYMLLEIQTWMKEAARFFPLSLVVSDLLWYFVCDLLIYRVLLVATVLLNLWLFFELIRAFGGGRRLGALAAVMAIGLFQLRDYHDPISSYSLILQNTLTLGMGSALLLRRFRDRGHWSWLGVSVALYACAILYYEAALSFIPILAYLALRKGPGPSPRKTGVLTAFGAVTTVYVGVVAYLRITQPVIYTGIQGSFHLKGVVTSIYQLSAALPLSYALFGRSGFYSWGTLASREFLSAATLGIWLCGIAVFGWIYRMPAAERSPRNQKELLFLGGVLAIGPALLIGLSARYQNEINRPGIGYLPVYYSYFGVGLLMALTLEKIKRRNTASILLAGWVAIAFSLNGIAADRLNRYWKYPRTLLEQALHQGLLEGVPDGSRLELEPGYSWATPTFLLHNTGKKIEFVQPGLGNHRINLKMLDGAHGEVSISPPLMTMRF